MKKEQPLHVPHCKYCAHKQNYDGEDRCARYHDSLCEKAYVFCKQKFFMHIDDGISLFAMKNWLNRLTSEEMELPLLVKKEFESDEILVPLFVFRYANVNKDCWLFYAKSKKDM